MSHHRRRVAALALFFTGATLTAASSLPNGWHAWRYRREISATHPDALNYITVGPDVLRNSNANISDLRILDESGAEVPFVLHSGGYVTEPKSLGMSLAIRENSFVPGKYTQILLDLGPNSPFHNSVRVGTQEPDFILWVEVAVSDDARTWRIVKERAPISRFRSEGLEGNQTVRYSENNARFVRLRVRDNGEHFRITDATVFPSFHSPIELIPEQHVSLLDSRAPDTTSRNPSITQWTVNFGSRNGRPTVVEFSTNQQEFYRAVRISESTDGEEWTVTNSGAIYRYVEKGRVEESLSIKTFAYYDRHQCRVEILNGNDAPLTNARLSEYMVPDLLLFRPAAGHSYRLAYGNEKASSPQYDLERTLHVTAAEQAFANSLGPEEQNASYQDPRPFSERHPELLWTALALGAVALAYTAFRTMRTPPPQQS